MGGRGSGKRSEAVRYTSKLPPLSDDEGSVRRYCHAVTRELIAGRLDPRAADTLIAAAREVRQSIGQERDRLVMTDLREMLARAEAVSRAGAAHAADARRHLGGGVVDQQDLEETDGEKIPHRN